MKTLYKYINEGILAGQENTIDDGDKLLKTINKEWNKIKALENFNYSQIYITNVPLLKN